jgi:hypothetical protein
MAFTIRPAVREKIGLLFGVSGPSGSGKTLTALLLAHGIAGKTGRIVVIDTEAGRALHYAPKPGEKADGIKTFDFLHLDFPPPFTPERYVEAVHAAEAAGGTVNVVDSMSHEWAGEGGCSDIQMVEAERMAKKANLDNWESQVDRMTAPAWKKPKQRHQRMMARLIQSRTHLIFCLRAQEKVKIVGGKVTPIGFMPISEKAFPFELSGSFMLHPANPGSPDYTMPYKLNADLRSIFPDGQIVGHEAGDRLRVWAETGADRPAVDKASDGVRDLIERIQDADQSALRALTADPSIIKQRAWLAEKRPELADRVDAAIVVAVAAFEPDGDLGTTTEASE